MDQKGTTIYQLRDGVNAWAAQIQPDGQHKTSSIELERVARLMHHAPDLRNALLELLVLIEHEHPEMEHEEIYVAKRVLAGVED